MEVHENESNKKPEIKIGEEVFSFKSAKSSIRNSPASSRSTSLTELESQVKSSNINVVVKKKIYKILDKLRQMDETDETKPSISSSPDLDGQDILEQLNSSNLGQGPILVEDDISSVVSRDQQRNGAGGNGGNGGGGGNGGNGGGGNRGTRRNGRSGDLNGYDGDNGDEEGSNDTDSFRMLRRPKDFNGDPREARKWLQDYEFCAKVNGWSATRKAESFPAFLAESARNWYCVAILNTRHEKNFDTIKEQFLSVFMAHSTKTTIANELDTKLQRKGEAVSIFIMDMRSLCLEYNPRMEEEEMFNKIRRRVLRSFEPQLSLKNPRTLRKLLTTCSLLEDGMLSREKNDTAAVVFKEVKCYSCNKLGHLSKDCTNKSKGRNPRPPSSKDSQTKKNDNHYSKRNDEGPEKPLVCYNCKGNGHMSKDCPSPRSDKNDKKPKPSNRPTSGRGKYFAGLVAYVKKEKGLFTQVHVTNNKVDALVDTGATMTILSSEKAASLNIKLSSGKPERLRTGNGSILSDSGSACVLIRASKNGTEAIAEHNVVIAKDLPVDMLLGMDLLERFNYIIDCSTKKLTLAKPSSKYIEEKGEGDCYCVSSITVPPKATRAMEVVGPGGEKEITVAPSRGTDSLLIPASINRTTHGTFTSMVTNPNNGPVTIEGRSVIGQWSPAKSIGELKSSASCLDSRNERANMLIKDEVMGEIELGDHLAPKQRKELIKLLRSYSSVFSNGGRLSAQPAACYPKVRKIWE